MDKSKAKEEIKTLSEKIEEHNYRYYVLSEPTVSDKEYDDLLRKLIKIEEQFQDLRSIHSPSQRVGVKLPKGTGSVKHKVKMYSLDNTYSIEELGGWDQRVHKGLPRENIEYVVELKMDGVSASLSYEKDTFILGATRGDGTTGEDVTHSLKTIRSIPLKLFKNKRDVPESLDVRAEIYMDKKAFEKLNQSRKAQGEDVFVNPRNATSGSIKLLDSRITAERDLSCFIHSFGVLKGGAAFQTQWEFLQTIKDWGFSVNPNSRLCKNIDEVIQYCQEFQNKRDSFTYDVDGVVIKVNAFEQQQRLGSTLKSPRWAVAFKFPAYQATTIINDITIQIGRTGVLTPVAELEPVSCGGVTISRSTLHNFDEIKRLGVAKGDRILVERAGDVIPKIVKVVEKAKGKRVAVVPPKKCPACKGEIVKDKDDVVAYKCNNLLCPQKFERGLVHFASRGAMDIEGLGESVVQQLLEDGIVRNLADIYFLKKDDLLKLDLFADKKAQNLLEAIEKSKRQSLSRFIFALGIPNVGAKVASILAQRYKSIDELMTIKAKDMAEIYEIGDVIAISVEYFFKQSSTKELIQKFKKVSLNMTEEEFKPTSTKFLTKKFVLTGELKQFTRSEAATIIRNLGGDISLSVSSKTDFVVVGTNPGSKFEKAKKLGLSILSEKKFKELINS